jgi:hypothetical protein
MVPARAAIAIALGLLAVVACGKKKPPVLRDPATLPHVDHVFPVVRSDRLPDTMLGDIRHCYQEALGRDPTLGGTLTLDIRWNPPFPADVNFGIAGGKIDAGFRYCAVPLIAPWNVLKLDAGDRVKVEVSLHGEMRREPAPPGWIAFGAVATRMLSGAPVKVLRTKVEGPIDEGVNGDLARYRTGTVVVDVEFTDEASYAACGGISDFFPTGAMPCPKVHHFKGDDTTVNGWVGFTLEDLNVGWKDDNGRHWFGDEAREVE